MLCGTVYSAWKLPVHVTRGSASCGPTPKPPSTTPSVEWIRWGYWGVSWVCLSWAVWLCTSAEPCAPSACKQTLAEAECGGRSAGGQRFLPEHDGSAGGDGDQHGAHPRATARNVGAAKENQSVHAGPLPGQLRAGDIQRTASGGRARARQIPPTSSQSPGKTNPCPSFWHPCPGAAHLPPIARTIGRAKAARR